MSDDQERVGPQRAFLLHLDMAQFLVATINPAILLF